MSRRQIMLLVLLPSLTVVGYFGCFAIAPELFRRLLQGESGLVELGTTALCVVAAMRATRLARSREVRLPRRVRTLFLAYAIMGTVVALEESSYGQNFGGWQSPQFFIDHNRQHETNLHNLFDSKPNKRLHMIADLGSMLGFVLLPLALHLRRRSASPAAPEALAHWIVPGFELVALVLLARIVAMLKGIPGLAPDLNELRELLWAWMACGYIEVMRDRFVHDLPPKR